MVSRKFLEKWTWIVSTETIIVVITHEGIIMKDLLNNCG